MTDTGNYPPKPNPMVPSNPYPLPIGGPNLPALRAVRDFITDIPDIENLDTDIPADGVAWNQGDWRCQTGMCFAGWAGALTGATFPYPADAAGDLNADAGDVPYVLKRAAVRDAEGKIWHIKSYAQHILGLTSEQARYLFDGSNTLDRINDVISAIEDGRPVTDIDGDPDDDDVDD